MLAETVDLGLQKHLTPDWLPASSLRVLSRFARQASWEALQTCSVCQKACAGDPPCLQCKRLARNWLPVTLRDDQALRESALRRFTGRHAHQSHDVSYWRAPHHRLTANGAAPLRSARWPSAAICRAGMHDLKTLAIPVPVLTPQTATNQAVRRVLAR
jgi:hypothetical protein